MSRYLMLFGRRLAILTGRLPPGDPPLDSICSILERRRIGVPRWHICGEVPGGEGKGEGEGGVGFRRFGGEERGGGMGGDSAKANGVINEVKGKIKAKVEGGTGGSRITIVLDVTDCSAPLEEVVEELERAGAMGSVSAYLSPVEGFIADVASHPLLAGPNRVVILRDSGYKELLAGIREWFGTNGTSFLYHVGFRAGVGFGRLHRDTAEKVGLKDPVQIYRNISAAMFQWAGFGVMEVEELTENGGVIVVKDSFECELGKNSATVYSQFVRGIIAGILAELFGYGFNVVEEECIARGAPTCRFRVRALCKKPVD